MDLVLGPCPLSGPGSHFTNEERKRKPSFVVPVVPLVVFNNCDIDVK